MNPLFVFRPEPGWSATAAAARDKGLEVRGEPLFAVEPVAWDVPEHHKFDALLAGSANVFRHGGGGLAALRDLPVLAVGDTTAKAAEQAGFKVAQTGQGGLQSLIDGLGTEMPSLLRLAGKEQVPLFVRNGIMVDTRVVYRTIARPLGVDSRRALQDGGVALLHSAAAATQLAAQCEEHGIARSAVTLVVIGPRVAEACGAGWHSIHIAASPTDADMLALTKALCQN